MQCQLKELTFVYPLVGYIFLLAFMYIYIYIYTYVYIKYLYVPNIHRLYKANAFSYILNATNNTTVFKDLEPILQGIR